MNVFMRCFLKALISQRDIPCSIVKAIVLVVITQFVRLCIELPIVHLYSFVYLIVLCQSSSYSVYVNLTFVSNVQDLPVFL